MTQIGKQRDEKVSGDEGCGVGEGLKGRDKEENIFCPARFVSPGVSLGPGIGKNGNL